MNAIAHAQLALLAVDDGDPAQAQRYLARAQHDARTTARRDRQIVEIAALVVAGNRRRATGLALMHTAEFAADADLLSGLVDGAGT
jgi:hypothetical protein